MNSIIESMKNHVSVRDFKDQSLDEETKKELITAAQSGSTSNFVQAFSIIEITDPDLRDQIANVSTSAPYVKKTGTFYVFIADLNRQANILKSNNQSLDGIKNMESLLVSVIDTTIAAENMANAAESLGLGICYIGGIRNDINKVSQLLKLPKYTIPVYGMTVGYPNKKNQPKPRMPISNQVSQNTYDSLNFNNLDEYESITNKYYETRSSNQQDTDWIQKNLDFFKNPRRQDIGDYLKKQGFSLK